MNTARLDKNNLVALAEFELNLCCEYSRVKSGSIGFRKGDECLSKETFQVRGWWTVGTRLVQPIEDGRRGDRAVFGRSTAWFSLFFFFCLLYEDFIGTKNRQRQKVQRQWCNRSEGEWGSPNWSWMDRDSSAGRSCVAVCPDLGSKRAPTIGSIRPRGCRTPRLCADFDCCRFASTRIAGTEKWTMVSSSRRSSGRSLFINGWLFKILLVNYR